MKKDGTAGKIVGDLEIWVKYDGVWLIKTKVKDVHEDLLLPKLEEGMVSIQRSIDRILKKMPMENNTYPVKDIKKFENEWEDDCGR